MPVKSPRVIKADRPRRPRRRSGPVATLFGIVLLVAAVYLAKPVLVPLCLAVLLSFILTPLVTLVQRRGVRRVPAVLVVVLSALIVAAVTSWVVGVEVGKLAQDLPTHTDQVKRKVQALQSHGGRLAKLYQMIQDVGQSEPTPSPAVKEKLTGVAPTILTPPATQPSTQPVVTAAPATPKSPVGDLLDYATVVLEPLADAGLVLILVIYILIQREELRNRMIGLLGHTRLAGTTRVTVEAASRLSKLLLAQLCVNVSFGAVFGLVLLILGVPYAFLWGFVTALLRFVPYVGTWIAAAGPIVLSFAISPGWAQPIGVFVVFVLLDLTTANVIEPILFGHSTGVSPVALLVAAVFWTWIWGPVGLVLSTPITICLVVLGQHVPRLRVLWLLLGDRPPLPPAVAFYQRLLAGDQREAADVVAERVAEVGLDPVYDEVLLPALRMTRREREFRGLTPADETFILDAAGQIVAGLNADVPAAPPVAGRRPTVLAVPAHHRGRGADGDHARPGVAIQRVRRGGDDDAIAADRHREPHRAGPAGPGVRRRHAPRRLGAGALPLPPPWQAVCGCAHHRRVLGEGARLRSAAGAAAVGRGQLRDDVDRPDPKPDACPAEPSTGCGLTIDRPRSCRPHQRGKESVERARQP